MEAEGAGAQAATLLLRDGVIILGAAMVFVMLFRRLGLGAVLGYLVAGAVVGPHGIGLISAPEEMLHIADFGIVLLLFLVGLELHPARLLRLRNDILGLGMLQDLSHGIDERAIWRKHPAVIINEWQFLVRDGNPKVSDYAFDKGVFRLGLNG